MKKNQGSRTADGAAALRAVHTLYDAAPVFSDPQALALTSRGLRLMVGSRLAYQLLARPLYEKFATLRAAVAVRSRYAEDGLQAVMNAGVSQYIIVGAGLDSFALRRPELAGRLQVYEVDHPDTQQNKQRRIAAAGFAVPGNLEFVPVDFERESLAQALARSSFQPGRGSFFSWLGVTHYLTREAFVATLAAIASISAPGSELVFDYSLPVEMLSAEHQARVREVHKYVARRGEPIIGQMAPKEAAQECTKLGMTVLEDLGGEQQKQRYFAGRSDGLAPTPTIRLMRVRTR